MNRYQQLAYEVVDGVATVTLDRPDQLNAFTKRMMDELLEVLDRVDLDDEVRAVVFTGRGRGFCAGADLDDALFERTGSKFSMDAHADEGGIITRRLLRSTKPLIAAINGPAVGFGITWTLPMDIRLASETASVGFVFVRRGLVPEACSTWLLPRIVGPQRAADWIFTGRLFDAQEAKDAGLVLEVHPPGDLLPAATRKARDIADNSSPVAVALSRAMLWRMLEEPSLDAAHEIESRAMYTMGRSADCRAGVAAFIEKRAAEFPMRVSTDMPDFLQTWRGTDCVESSARESRSWPTTSGL